MTFKREILIANPNGDTFSIPNAWDLLTPDQYMKLCGFIQDYSQGYISAGMVKLLYVCMIMGWNPNKIDTDDDEVSCNLAMLAEQVTFIFNIVYADDIVELLSAEERVFFSKVCPERSTQTMARYLAKQEYSYALDSCFCAQLVPAVEIEGQKFNAYTVNHSFDTLTTSLVALQYVEAMELVGGKKEHLPLLASILYQDAPYNSEKAHKEAEMFAKLPDAVLEAIALNFISFNNFLFRCTPYKLLTEGRSKSSSSLAIDAADSLYNLSTDGYGDLNTVQQMNLIQYLSINRKKTIDTVRSLHESDVKMTDIAEKTGLPFHIINEIIK